MGGGNFLALPFRFSSKASRRKEGPRIHNGGAGGGGSVGGVVGVGGGGGGCRAGLLGCLGLAFHQGESLRAGQEETLEALLDV